MAKTLASCLILLASAASAATPLENASAVAAALGASVSAPEAAAIAAPAGAPFAAAPTPAKPASAAPGAVKIASLTGASGSVSGYASATGNGTMNCSGGPAGSGWMSGWINLSAQVSVTTDDGASAQFPVSGTVFLSGSCQRGSGFVSGSAQLNGSGSLYKAGRYAGTVSLSGNPFINQYVTGPFAWITQNVYLSGTYSESAVAAK